MDEKLIKLLAELAAKSPMKTAYVSTAGEHDAVCTEMEAQGLRLAATSSAGLPRGVFRLTFLPASAFKEQYDEAR